jgi:hypothetical protein
MDITDTTLTPVVATGFVFGRTPQGDIIAHVISDPSFGLAASGRVYAIDTSVKLTEMGALAPIRNLALELSKESTLLGTVAETIGATIDEAKLLPWQP